MMLVVFVIVSVVASLSSAFVCLPEMCEHVTQPVLSCKGGVIKNGGICGCTDVCAKMEGETCQAVYSFGILPEPPCDTGLHCETTQKNILGRGYCVKTNPDKRESTSRTLCEQMRMSSMISMVVYEGQWFAKCDFQGNFLPMQCDNTKHCFCVNTNTGEVLEGTKVLGAAKC